MRPFAGFTPTPAQMFMSPVKYPTARFEVLIAARSRSGMSQPTGRPESAAWAPLTFAVQSWLLSSIQRPAAFLRTMSATRGGVPLGACGGLNAAPALGGGLAPA